MSVLNKDGDKVVLNEWNDKTKGIIHLMVTSLCDYNCKYCCNKQYDLNSIPHVRDEELKECNTLFLTGGDPFKYAQPGKIARHYKSQYNNIRKVYAYTRASSLTDNLLNLNNIDGLYIRCLDGVSISIVDDNDLNDYNDYIANNYIFRNLFTSNRLYVYDENIKLRINKVPDNTKIVDRIWQKNFKPHQYSIFRKV